MSFNYDNINALKNTTIKLFSNFEANTQRSERSDKSRTEKVYYFLAETDLERDQEWQLTCIFVVMKVRYENDFKVKVEGFDSYKVNILIKLLSRF
jgi:hypothetical protein